MSPGGAVAEGADLHEIDEYVYKGKWWKNRVLIKLNLLLLLALVTSAGNGYDGSMMNGLQAVSIWQEKFGHPTGGILGLFNAAQNIGGIASLPLQAYVTDHFGRKRAIAFGCVLMLAGIAMQTASNTIGVFIGARTIIGFGLGFAANAAPCLISELAYPTQRVGMTALYNSLWYLGSIIAAWATFGTFRIPNNWSWRIPSALQAFSAVIQVALISFFSQWSGNGIASYYLSLVLTSAGITDESTQNLYNGCLQIFNMIVAIIASFMAERLGRRFLFITSAAGMAVSFAAWTLCAGLYAGSGNAAAGKAILGIIFVYYGFYDIAFTPLVVAYPVEILPFSIRAKGLVVNSTVVTVALVFNQYVNPVALEALKWKYYIVYSAWLVFETWFVWAYVVETKGLTLEETARIFDGQDALAEIQHGAEVRTPTEELDGDFKEKDKSSAEAYHVERV